MDDISIRLSIASDQSIRQASLVFEKFSQQFAVLIIFPIHNSMLDLLGGRPCLDKRDPAEIATKP
ncbi:MAG: hypothetical protein ACR2PF_00190 [Rhizobiaceae bacterium]